MCAPPETQGLGFGLEDGHLRAHASCARERWPEAIRAHAVRAATADEELESVELTRGKDTEEERTTPARTPPREDSPAARTAAPPPPPDQGAGVGLEAPRPVVREAPPVQYGPLELRRREGGGGAHCWQTLHPSEFEVRGANYLRDGKKLPSDQTSSLLAVELFQSADTVYNVAGRPGAPTASLAARATEHPIRSVLVVNLVIPAQEGYP